MLAQFLAGVFQREDLYVPAYLRWLYVDNPAGTVIGVNAWADDRIAAHYAVLPIQAASADGPHRAALSLNTATDPAHQGRALFTRLAEATFALAKEEGVREILGIANASSTPGFVRKLGFRDCGPLEARLLWRRPGLRAAESEASWQRVWDADSLAWRARNPQVRYTVEVGAGLRFIMGPTGWPGIRAVLRMEAADTATPLPDLQPAAWGPFRLWLGRSSRIALPRAGSLSIPMRLRPSPLKGIHLPLAENVTSPDPERIHFEAFDGEAY